jgi:hypothetical protein
MEAAGSYETSYILHGVTSQKTVLLRLRKFLGNFVATTVYATPLLEIMAFK